MHMHSSTHNPFGSPEQLGREMALKLVDGKASLEVRALSRTVLDWRSRRGWPLAELEKHVGFSTAKLSMLCTASQRFSALDVMKIGGACDVDDEEVELCVRAAQRALDPQMWDRINGDAWPRLTWTYWDVAAEATELVIVAMDALPELVHTDAYHAAMLKSGATAHELDPQLKEAVLARLALGIRKAARPGSLGPLRVRLIVPESVLASGVGGSRVMADQLRHLEELNRLPGFEITVVDNDAGPYFGMGTSFTMMRFVERRFDDVVHARTLHGDNWFESAAERSPYERVLDALAEVTRTPERSSLWLGRNAMLLQDPLPSNGSEHERRLLLSSTVG